MVKAFASVSFFLAMGAGWVADWVGQDKVSAVLAQARDLFDPVRTFGPTCPADRGFDGTFVAV